MNEELLDPLCVAVRAALLSGSFEGISRQEADEHLATHAPCARWAAETLLLRHLLATGQGSAVARGVFDTARLEAYLDRNLPDVERQALEAACCCDLKLAGRLRRLRESRLGKRVRMVDTGVALRLIQAVVPSPAAGLAARLESFRGLYFHRPLAVAAAQSQRSVFQTPDGTLVVSVVDKGAPQPGEPHLVELGIRVHDPNLIDRWACYRVTDGRDTLVAAGLVKTEEHGASIRLTVPPTEHPPYTVHAEVLNLDTSKLEAVLGELASETQADDE